MAKLKYTLLNNHFLHLPEVKVLRNKFKSQGILAVIACYLAMSGAANASLSSEELEIIALDEGIKDVKEWLDYCLSKNLIIIQNGSYTNKHVQRDQESYGKKLESDRNRKSKRQAESIRNEDRNRCDPDIVIDIDNDIDIKNKEVPQGLKLVGVHTYLSDISKEQLKKRYLDEGLGVKDIKRAIEYLDKHFEANPEKRYPIRDHRLDLTGWPLDQVRKTKSELERAKPQEKPKINSVPASESMHPAVRAQREREAKESLDRLGMGGLAK